LFGICQVLLDSLISRSESRAGFWTFDQGGDGRLMERDIASYRRFLDILDVFRQAADDFAEQGKTLGRCQAKLSLFVSYMAQRLERVDLPRAPRRVYVADPTRVGWPAEQPTAYIPRQAFC